MYAVAPKVSMINNRSPTVVKGSSSQLKRVSRASLVRVYAASPEEPESAPEAEPAAVAAETTTPPPAAASTPIPEPKTPGFGEVMAFSGAPELINGRLAMLAFVAALGAELSTGESVFAQFKDAPISIIGTFIVFSAASMIPIFKNAKREALGPLTPDAELTNGRAAMLGFASLMLVEVFRGSALF